MKQVVAELTHLARKASEISQRSGVSVRVTICNWENVLSSALKELPSITVDITARDVPGLREVDHKLIDLARELSGKIVTNDGNLGMLAGLSGVPVLNLNELAQAVKPVALPGEAMDVHVVKEGKESGQGVGYLDDGTMVVVDQGKRLLGQTLRVVVTSVLQTAAGRMIFARPRDGEPGAERRG
jgi:uncharacterized protein YacL